MEFPEFKLGMGQMLVEDGKVKENLERAEETMSNAAKENCQVIVLPECSDVGWDHPSARELAEEIPGETSGRLCEAAKKHNIMVVTGLSEREGNRIYNSAILIDQSGKILLKHRKINLTRIEQDLYSVGNMLGVAETRIGTIGVNICADNFGNSLAIGHVLARMGAHFILSPSAWAVKPDHDNAKDPYGEFWRQCYEKLCRLYEITIVGVSNVGWIEAGSWKGWKVIGCSLAVGPDGGILAKGPYGHDAQALVTLKLRAWSRDVKGEGYGPYLKRKGYEGP